MKIIKLIVRDDKLDMDVRDDQVASSEVAEGGTHVGRTGRVTWKGLK